MAESSKVLVLPGDGIGPEVCQQAVRVLELVQEQPDANFEIEQAAIGGNAIDAGEPPLPPGTLAKAQAADAVLLGAVGGPGYDGNEPARRPETGLLELRAGLGVFANLRPIRTYPELAGLRNITAGELDIQIVRELTGGIYFGEPRGFRGEGKEREAFNTMRYSHAEIERIAIRAFQFAKLASKRVCSVDKANVLEVSRLWREVVSEVGASFPEVPLSHMYVDNAAMQLVANPGQFDVLLTSNMFGDILSDLASQITGSIGMLPSASFGAGKTDLYEPIHGSAPDIAGSDAANPCGAILSVALLAGHSLQLNVYRFEIEAAVADVIAAGMRTADIAAAGDKVSGCAQMGDAIVANLKQRLLKLRAS